MAARNSGVHGGILSMAPYLMESSSNSGYFAGIIGGFEKLTM
jgi:hypothetical protein